MAQNVLKVRLKRSQNATLFTLLLFPTLWFQLKILTSTVLDISTPYYKEIESTTWNKFDVENGTKNRSDLVNFKAVAKSLKINFTGQKAPYFLNGTWWRIWTCPENRGEWNFLSKKHLAITWFLLSSSTKYFEKKFQILLPQANVDIRWRRFEEEKSKTLKTVYHFWEHWSY